MFLAQSYFIYRQQTAALTYFRVRLAGQHDVGGTQNRVIIIHEVLLCMLLHLLLQRYSSTYMNIQTIHATLTCLLLLIPFALGCMRLLIKTMTTTTSCIRSLNS